MSNTNLDDILGVAEPEAAPEVLEPKKRGRPAKVEPAKVEPAPEVAADTDEDLNVANGADVEESDVTEGDDQLSESHTADDIADEGDEGDEGDDTTCKDTEPVVHVDVAHTPDTTCIVVKHAVTIYRGPNSRSAFGKVVGAIHIPAGANTINGYIKVNATIRGVGRVSGYIRFADIQSNPVKGV